MRALLTILLLLVASACQTPSSGQLGPLGDVPEQLLTERAGEGPAWHPDWGLLFSGDGDITRYKGLEATEIFRQNAGSNGLLFDREGRLLICEPKQRRVTRLDQAGQLTVLTDQFQGKRYNQPNDITLDSQGRIYFSDPRYGQRTDMQILDEQGQAIEGVYRIDADGTVSQIIAHEVDRPNGLLITPDDRFLFVADNNNNEVGGARKLWRFELAPDGTVVKSSQQLIYDWETGRGPDGMAIDQQGNLYVAGGRTKPNPPAETAAPFLGGIYVFSPAGKLIQFKPIPHDEVTNCSFGGPDLRDLYVTAGGTLWKFRTVTPGVVHWSQ